MTKEQNNELNKFKKKHGNEKPFIELGATCGKVFEVRFANGKEEYLQTFQNLAIPTEWVSFNSVPNGAMNFLINELLKQYETEIEPPW